MAHFLQALLAKETIIHKIAADYPTDVIELPQGFGMITLKDSFYNAVSGESELVREEFYSLTGKIVSLMAHHAINTPIAYIETEYFGGAGEQGAYVIKANKVIFAQHTTLLSTEDYSEYPINEALKLLGVTQVEQLDEFDSLGLGWYRKND